MDDLEKITRSRTKIFKALAEPLRLQMLELLRQDNKCVCDIFPCFGIAQPLASRHLKILKNCGLVKDRKQGNRRFYSVTDPRIFSVIDAVTPELIKSLSKCLIEQII